MPSLKSLFLLTSTVFAAFASAAPLSPPTGPTLSGLGDASSAYEKPPTDFTNVGTYRREELKTLPTILTVAHHKLAEVSHRLHIIVEGTTTTINDDVAEPILHDVKLILDEVVADVKPLVGRSLNVILAFGGRVLTIRETADLLATVVSLVVAIVSIVVKCVVGGLENKVIAPLVVVICNLVADILLAILALVGGLLEVLVPYLEPIVPVIRTVGWVKVLTVLHL